MTCQSRPYLAAVRQVCRQAMQSTADAVLQRELAQACAILGRMLAEDRVGPPVDRAARGEWERLERIRQILREEELHAASPGPRDDGFDPARIESLRRFLGGAFRREVRIRSIATMALGYSKETLLVRAAGDDVPAELIVRMDRAGSFLGTSVRSEFPVLQVLHARGAPVPRPYALESEGAVLGQPFLLMERATGRNVGSHFSFPSPSARLLASMAAALARIHLVPVTDFGGSLAPSASASRERLADELDRLLADWRDTGADSPTLESAFTWLRSHLTDGVGENTLIHGDFSLSNVLIEGEDRVAAVLDWEFARLGNPALDLGWFYFSATRLGEWEYFLQAYRSAGARLPEERQLDFYVLWGMARLAVLCHQQRASLYAQPGPDIKGAYAAALFPPEAVARLSRRLAQRVGSL